MLRPRFTPIAPPAACQPMPYRFTVLVWNVHKLPFSRLSRCLDLAAYDLWLLQESRLSAHDTPQHPWAMSPNLQRRGTHFGVLTAARSGLYPLNQILSTHRERWWMHKSALLSAHPLADGRTLRVLNVHLLLSASRRRVAQELRHYDTLLHPHDGPLIIAGDFNSWSRLRLAMLSDWAADHQLYWPTPEQVEHVRAHRARALDHLLYRGLKLTHFSALASPCSDHNPLVARFEL